MRKWVTLALAAILLLCPACSAAQWPEGRGASQPYTGTPPVNLEKTMGYILLFPRATLPASTYCDTLEIYLPREDVELGEGGIRLMRLGEDGKGAEQLSVEFADRERVSIQPLTEAEMDNLMWGGGVCIRVRLPRSLEYGVEDYYVTMDEGCFTALNGALKSLEIANPEAWTPKLRGDYGVGGLYYSDGSGTEQDAEYKTRPEIGDRIDFDLVLGGEAAFAVVYSENDSVTFAEIEYTQSGHVTGEVKKDELDWGIVFLDKDGEMLEVVRLGR